MATLTPSGLIKPEYTDPASVDPINDNSDRIDEYGLGAYVIDGDTFPSDPWEGMKVFKRDYSELYVYSTLDGAVDPGQWWLLGAGRKINYTPVLNNVTLGTDGVVEGQYFRVGHNGLPNAVAIYWRVHIALGTGGDVTDSLEFGLPGVPEMWSMASNMFMMQVGHALSASSSNPASANCLPGIVICTTTTAVGSGGETQQVARVTPDSATIGSLWNGSVPHDWAAGYNLWAQGWYWPDQNGESWT
jgi:hypothetical protein